MGNIKESTAAILKLKDKYNDIEKDPRYWDNFWAMSKPACVIDEIIKILKENGLWLD
jgi:hypothetical protein